MIITDEMWSNSNINYEQKIKEIAQFIHEQMEDIGNNLNGSRLMSVEQSARILGKQSMLIEIMHIINS